MDKKDLKLKRIEFFDCLSGGNHELFHSNILAFIAKNYPDFFKSIFSLGGLDYNPDNVEREKNNFDLSISNGREYIFVLENKMKSIVNHNQLMKYNEKIEKKNKKTGTNCIKIILTLLRSDISKENTGWTTFTYKELGDRMRKGFMHLNTNPPYLGQFLEDYVNYIDELYKNVDNWGKELSKRNRFKILIYWELNSKERTWLSLFKAKVLFEYIAEYIKKGSEFQGYAEYCKVSTGITHAVPFLEFAISFQNNEIIKVDKNETDQIHMSYWLQIYPHEIQQGFTLPYKIKGQINKKDKDQRSSLIENVWKMCHKNPILRNIGLRNFNSKQFDKEKFLPKLKGKRKQRAYLYDDVAMVYYIDTIHESTQIFQYFDTIVRNIGATINELKEKIQ